MIRFRLKCWHAWLPQELRPAKVASNAGGLLPGSSPDVSFLPLMQRRRLSPMARAAVAAAWPCLKEAAEIPVVCCSLHGETRHCFGILTVLAAGGEISPTQFALSVHGAVGGLLTQFAGSRAPWLAIAPGDEGYSAALLEAAGFLLEEKEVVVVWYEQPLPPVYRAYAPDPPGVMALAVRLGAWQGEGICLTAERVAEAPPETGRDPLLRLIEAFCAGAGRWMLAAAKDHWRWELGRG